VTIFSLTPVIEVGDSGVLTIERTDEPGERYETALSKGSLGKQKFDDIASAKEARRHLSGLVRLPQGAVQDRSARDPRRPAAGQAGAAVARLNLLPL